MLVPMRIRDARQDARPRAADLQRLPLLRGLLRGLPGHGAAARVRGRRSQLPGQPLPRLPRLLLRLPVRAAARVRRQPAARRSPSCAPRPTRNTPGPGPRAGPSAATARWCRWSIALGIALVLLLTGLLGDAGGALRRAHRPRRVLRGDPVVGDGVGRGGHLLVLGPGAGRGRDQLLARHRLGSPSRARAPGCARSATWRPCATWEAAATGATSGTRRFSQARRWLHHALFYGFALCFASTTVAAFYEHGLGRLSPFPLAEPAGAARDGGRLRHDDRHRGLLCVARSQRIRSPARRPARHRRRGSSC